VAAPVAVVAVNAASRRTGQGAAEARRHDNDDDMLVIDGSVTDEGSYEMDEATGQVVLTRMRDVDAELEGSGVDGAPRQPFTYSRPTSPGEKV